MIGEAKQVENLREDLVNSIDAYIKKAEPELKSISWRLFHKSDLRKESIRTLKSLKTQLTPECTPTQLAILDACLAAIYHIQYLRHKKGMGEMKTRHLKSDLTANTQTCEICKIIKAGKSENSILTLLEKTEALSQDPRMQRLARRLKSGYKVKEKTLTGDDPRGERWNEIETQLKKHPIEYLENYKDLNFSQPGTELRSTGPGTGGE